MAKSTKLKAFAENAEETARRQQAIQKDIDRKDKAAGSKPKATEPMQAGAREYPAELPAQHLIKPGMEEDLSLAPKCSSVRSSNFCTCSWNAALFTSTSMRP